MSDEQDEPEAPPTAAPLADDDEPEGELGADEREAAGPGEGEAST